jgi:hypothetical protein
LGIEDAASAASQHLKETIMTSLPTSRDYALMQPAAKATVAKRQYKVSLTAWTTAEIWVSGIDEHDAMEHAHLLWGCGHDNAFTDTDGGIDKVSILESR